MKKADIPVVSINGDNNNVEVNVTVTETSTNTPAAIVIALGVFTGAAVLAVSQCCPELLADFVCWIISVAVGG